jgi:FkbM family methyltransferase
MNDIVKIISEKSSIVPTNIFEIGTGYKADAEHLRQAFNITPENVFCFEPNPENFFQLTSHYPTFNSFNMAISNITGEKSFQCCRITDISSFKKRVNAYHYETSPKDDYKEITIHTSRMDDFIEKHNISQIDVCKIDVEGCTYEVLEGFGNKLNTVKFLHVEAEKSELYENQKLFKDIIGFFTGFTMVDYTDLNDGQCDSMWVRNDFLKIT